VPRFESLSWQNPQIALVLIGDPEFIAVHFPFNSNEKIEMHAFGFEPCFQILTGIRAELDEHSSFEHVDEYALRAREPAGLHSLGKSFGSLAGETSERVLREVAWHRNSCGNLNSKYFIEAARTRLGDSNRQAIPWKIHETEAKRDAANNVLGKNHRRVANRSDDVGEELRNMDLSEMAG
jgi:hypothetical protein